MKSITPKVHGLPAESRVVRTTAGFKYIPSFGYKSRLTRCSYMFGNGTPIEMFLHYQIPGDLPTALKLSVVWQSELGMNWEIDNASSVSD